MKKNLDQEIWNILIFSLISTSLLLGTLQYLQNNTWWKEDQYKFKSQTKDPDSAMVYYSVVGVGRYDYVDAKLLVGNTVQEQIDGAGGVFENVVPDGIISVEAEWEGYRYKSPNFILRKREIKHVIFRFNGKQIVYAKSYTRFRKGPNFSNNVNLAVFKKPEPPQWDVVSGEQDYAPMGAGQSEEQRNIVCRNIFTELNTVNLVLVNNPKEKKTGSKETCFDWDNGNSEEQMSKEMINIKNL